MFKSMCPIEIQVDLCMQSLSGQEKRHGVAHRGQSLEVRRPSKEWMPTPRFSSWQKIPSATEHENRGDKEKREDSGLLRTCLRQLVATSKIGYLPQITQMN